MEIYYIDETTLKDLTSISSDVDPNLLLPTILKSQDIYITTYLGDTIDQELKLAIDSTTTTLIQDGLLEIIQKSLAHFTHYRCLEDLAIRLNNKGVYQAGNENSNPISESLMIFARNQIKNDAEFYLNRAGKYMVLNKDSFPSFSQNCICQSEVNKSGYDDFPTLF